MAGRSVVYSTLAQWCSKSMVSALYSTKNTRKPLRSPPLSDVPASGIDRTHCWFISPSAVWVLGKSGPLLSTDVTLFPGIHSFLQVMYLPGSTTTVLSWILPRSYQAPSRETPVLALDFRTLGSVWGFTSIFHMLSGLLLGVKELSDVFKPPSPILPHCCLWIGFI